MTRTALGLIVAASALAGACGPRGPEVAGLPDTIDFNFHVKPILSDRCFKCHGPDDRTRKAGLRLDVKEAALARLPSGHRAIVPGSTRRSALVARVLSTDPAVLMPAPESNLTLTDYERAVLVRWIEQGAEWKPHWSLIPPTKPPVPTAATAGWARNEIDRFILATLDSKGLKPRPEASRETLIRRLSFDLTGLPPTVADIDAFVGDPSPGAYEAVVDRLLASPAYGERMAADWLDLARYADSHGYQDDGMRAMWPWRDWVIAAFNRNLPIDQFITWQLAGDLLPNATDEQRLATGFNRNHMQSQEGGIVPEEYRTEYVVDRVNTLGRAFLGISVECARCHDHKYDPISQKEFFRLYAFFNNVNETGQIPYSGVPSPTVLVRDTKADAALAVLADQMRPLEPLASPAHASYDTGFARWLATAAASVPVVESVPTAGLVAHLPLDPGRPGIEIVKGNPKKKTKPKRQEILEFANVANPRANAKLGGDQDRVPETVPGHVGQALRLVGDSHIAMMGERFAFFERHQPFSLGLWMRVERPGTSGPLVTRSGGLANGNRGYEIILRKDGTFTAGLHHVFPDNSIEIETVAPVTVGMWHHVALTYDGSSRASGLRVFVDGDLAASRVLVDNLRRSIIHDGQGGNWEDNPAGLRIGRRGDETLQDVAVDEFRVYDRQLSVFEAATLGGRPGRLRDVVARPLAERTAAERAALREHYALRVDPDFRAAFERLSALRGKHNALLTALTEVMVMRDLPTPRPTFVLARGAYDAPTERVTAGTPRALGDYPPHLPADRLGLARWLLDPGHPLTARVFVNRVWAGTFGRGLVATPADFGNQGRLPTHPALLDWLATTFVESKWDLKRLQKRLVMSATYRQSSAADAALLEADLANEWLARGPSHRLSAEQIRDNALAASGLLVRTIGGPSVYPYQPPGLWEELATRNATSYVVGTGDDLHRRSLYTVWKRTSPPPSATSFDAAERLFCTVARQRTNTPLQALVLMNDPQYVEAARMLAERVLREGGATTEDRITLTFRLLTSRRPDAKELALLARLYQDERARFARDRAAALALLSVGTRDRQLDPIDVAAHAIVATTVMNLDEAVFKR